MVAKKFMRSLDFYGDFNVGMWGMPTEKFCLVGTFADEKAVKAVEECLKVPVIKISVANTSLVGIFVTGNSNGILLPHIVSDHERKNIEKLVDCKVAVLKTDYTALGNLILANDKGAVVSKVFKVEDLKKIKDALDVEIVKGTIAGTPLVGSGAVATQNGLLVTSKTKEPEMKLLEEALHVQGDYGSANFGSPWVGACLLANSNGVVIGSATTAPEMTRISEALGFL
jgi:translation initiation factor 6